MYQSGHRNPRLWLRRAAAALTAVTLFCSVLPAMGSIAQGEETMLQPENGGVIDTVASGKALFSDTADYTFNQIPANFQGVSYIRGTMAEGCQATAVKAGYVYVITPVNGDQSQAEALLRDGFEEADFTLSQNLYSPAPLVPNNVYEKYVMAGAKISFGGWGLLLFSETPVNLEDVILPTMGGEVGVAQPGEKIWTDQDTVFKELPDFLTGAKFILSGQTQTNANIVKHGFLYVLTPARGYSHSLADGLERLGYEEIEIPEFELYEGADPVALYGKLVLPEDKTLSLGNWNVTLFSEEQLNVADLSSLKLGVLKPQDGLEVDVARRGAKIWTNRDFLFDVLPEFLEGKAFVRGAIDGGYTVTARQEGYVYAMTPMTGGTSQKQTLLDQGFEELPYLWTKRLHLSQAEQLKFYRKNVTKGETLRIGRFGVFFFDHDLGVGELAVLEGLNGGKIMELQPMARLFRNRHFFAFHTLPEFLNGKSFLLSDIEGGSFTVKESGTVVMLTPDEGIACSQAQMLLDKGFERLNYPAFIPGSGVSEQGTFFAKYMEAGETLEYSKWAIPVGASLPQEDYDIFPSDTPADIMLRPESGYGTEDRQWQGCSTLEETKGGRFWAGWFTGGTGEPQSDNYGTISVSDDRGETWIDHVLTVVHPSDKVRVEDVQFWRDPLDRLWLFWTQSNCIENAPALGTWANFDMTLGVWTIRIDNPDAPLDEITWTEPRRISPGLMRCKPIVLSTGEWMLSIYDNVDGNYSKVYTSTDAGETWTLKGQAYCKNNNLFDENMTVEREDGSLLMYMRTLVDGTGLIQESVSYNGGRTWSAARPNGLYCANSRFYVGRLASGNLLLVANDHPTSRTNMTVFLSEDDGKTWPYKLVLDTRPGITYPDAVQSPDGMIHVIYDRNRNGKSEILWTSFTEEDLKAGEFVSANAAPPHILNKLSDPPAVSPAGYIYYGEDLSISPDLQDAVFQKVEGNGITEEDYTYTQGQLVLKKAYLDTLGEGSFDFDLVTDLATLSFRVTKLPVDEMSYTTEGIQDLTDFTEKAAAGADGAVFSLEDGVIHAAYKGTTGWPVNSLILKDRLYQNASVQVAVKRDTETDGFPLVFFGRSDPAANNEKAGGGFAVGIQKEGILTVYANDPIPVIMHQVPDGLYKDGEYNTLKIVAQGNKYQIYLNGTYLETYVDSDRGDHAAGFAGIATSGCAAFFKDFQVTVGDLGAVAPGDATAEFRFDTEEDLSHFTAYYAEKNASAGQEVSFNDYWTLTDGYIQRKGATPNFSMDNIASLLYTDTLLKNYEISVDYQRDGSNVCWAALVGKQRKAGNSGMTSGFSTFVQKEGIVTMWGEAGITNGPYAPITIGGYVDTAWHNLKIKVVNREIFIYVDGQQMIYVNTLAPHFLLNGLVGMQSFDNNCRFDNFVVTRLDDHGNPQSLSVPEEKTHILCVGDSITYGQGASNALAAYPSQLQELLGDGYVVTNYGIAGRAALKQSDAPIWEDIEYPYSLKGDIPDVVVLMLGTNDAKDSNWVHKADYAADLKELIASYQALNPHVKIILGTSPTLYTAQGSGLEDATLVNEVIPLQKQVAEEMGCLLVDIHTLTQDMEEHFPDKIHPDDYGYRLLAETFRDAVLLSLRPNAAEVEHLAPLTVPYGTGFDELNLPATIRVTGDDGNAYILPVTWQAGNYNGNAAGTYTLTGALDLTGSELLNPDGLTASIQVTVEPQPGPSETTTGESGTDTTTDSTASPTTAPGPSETQTTDATGTTSASGETGTTPGGNEPPATGATTVSLLAFSALLLSGGALLWFRKRS